MIFGVFMTSVVAGEEATVDRIYCWWHPGVARRVDGGWVVQPLVLRRLGLGAGPETSVEIFVRTIPMGRFNGSGRDEQPPSWWRLSVTSDAIEITGGAYFRVAVWARIRSGDAEHWAVTHFNLYGQASEAVIRDAVPVSPEAAAAFPLFELTSDGEGYWPQTGQTFTVRPDWSGADGVTSMSVRDEHGREWACPQRNADGGFVYRPPHDKALDRAGDTASKPYVFVAAAPNGNGSVCYTLAVHRSRWANYRLLPGLGVLVGGMGVAGGVVWRRRRSDPWHGR